MIATATASEIAAYMGGGVLLCIMCEFAFIIGVEWWCEMFARRNERRKRERTIGARAQNPRIVPAHGAGGILPDHANPPRAQEADAPLACLAQRADRWGGSRQTLQGGAK